MSYDEYHKPANLIIKLLDWQEENMFTSLKIPTYKKMLELTDTELIQCVNEALDQLRQAEEQGDKTTEKTKVYMLYKSELAKRTYRRRSH